MKKRYESDFFQRGQHSLPAIESKRIAEREIATVGFSRSSNAGELFREFAARRLSVVPTEEDYEYLTRISQIIERGAGNSHELAFVLVNLFMWNGIVAELVHVYSNKEASPENRDLGELEYILVYVPSRDRYFYPSLRASAQLPESGIGAWLEDRPRIYSAYPSDITALGYYGRRSTPAK